MDYSGKKLVKRLTKALIVSVVLNTLLLGLISYWFYSTPYYPYGWVAFERSNEKSAPLPPFQNSSLEQELSILIKTGYKELSDQLENRELVDSGYTKRDLALAALVSSHHFNLPRALSGAEIKSRNLIIAGKKISLFTGLEESHFEAIIHFALSERWPFTTYGLFLLLKQKDPPPATLKEAFKLTAEFINLELLFKQSPADRESDTMLQMVIEGSWELFSTFAADQKAARGPAVNSRQKLLLEYIAQKSAAAAELLLQCDATFAVRKLSDDQVVAIMELLDKKKPLAEKFSLAMLISPRSDKVWLHAAKRLYLYAEEPLPASDPHAAALERFAAIPAIKQPVPSPALSKSIDPPLIVSEAKTEKKSKNSKESRYENYTVLPGDSLWKVAKKFKVDMESIKRLNELSSDVLREGKVIKIPIR